MQRLRMVSGVLTAKAASEQRSQSRALVLCIFVIISVSGMHFNFRQSSVAQARRTHITVSTTEDELNADGYCSLREAIQAANTDASTDACPAGSGDDIIELAAGIYTLLLHGAYEDNNATGDLDIKGDLTINGAGADSTVIDGNQLSRILHIHSGFTVAINDTKIAHGKTASGDPILGGPGIPGAGIYNNGTLILTNSVVSGNTTGNGGSGVFGGMVGAGGAGAGIYNVGTLTLNSSIVSNNTTGNGGGGLGFAGAGGAGGGIFNAGMLILNNSTVSDNTTGNGGNGPGGGRGGTGGGISSIDGTVDLHDSVISGNIANGAGGGLYLVGSDTIMVNNVIMANQADMTGSGIYILGGRARLLHSTIVRNGYGSALHITDSSSYPHSTVELTNTILVSQTVGSIVTPNSAALFNSVLWFGNGMNTGGGGTITVMNEHTGNPAFAIDGYHLTSQSAAIDAGVNGGVITDIDSEPRFGTPDLGADELVTFTVTRVCLPMVLR